MNQSLRMKALELATGEISLTGVVDVTAVTERAAAYLKFLEGMPAAAPAPGPVAAPEDDIVIRVGTAAEPETAQPQFERGDIVQRTGGGFGEVKNGGFYAVRLVGRRQSVMSLDIDSPGALCGWHQSRFRLVARAAEGWNIWNGGPCPVGPDVLGQVIFRDDTLPGITKPELIAGCFWDHSGGAGDIVAYRVEVQPKAAEPAKPERGQDPTDLQIGDEVVYWPSSYSEPSETAGKIVGLDAAGRLDVVWDTCVHLSGGYAPHQLRLKHPRHAERALQPGDRVKHDGDLYEIVAGPRMWKGREEIAVWSDDSGYSQLDVADVERVS